MYACGLVPEQARCSQHACSACTLVLISVFVLQLNNASVHAKKIFLLAVPLKKMSTADIFKYILMNIILPAIKDDVLEAATASPALARDFVKTILLTMDGEIGHFAALNDPQVEALLDELAALVLKYAAQVSGKFQPLDVAKCFHISKSTGKEVTALADPLQNSVPWRRGRKVSEFLADVGASISASKKKLIVRFFARIDTVIDKAFAPATVRQGFVRAGVHPEMTAYQRTDVMLQNCTSWRSFDAATQQRIKDAIPALKRKMWAQEELTDDDLVAALQLPELAEAVRNNPSLATWRKRAVLYGPAEKQRFRARLAKKEAKVAEASKKRAEREETAAFAVQDKLVKQDELKRKRAAAAAAEEAKVAERKRRAEEKVEQQPPKRAKAETKCRMCNKPWKSGVETRPWGVCDHCSFTLCADCMGAKGVRCALMTQHERKCAQNPM